MTSYQGARVTVPRDLWISALADAIDWTSSLLDSQHDAGMSNPVQELLLARYQKAYARATGAKRGPIQSALDNARAIPIHELPLSDEVRWPRDRSES